MYGSIVSGWPVARAVVQLGLEEGEIGGVERGDVPLDAVQQVAVAVAAGGRLDGRALGPGPPLRDRLRLFEPFWALASLRCNRTSRTRSVSRRPRRVPRPRHCRRMMCCRRNPLAGPVGPRLLAAPDWS